MFERFIVDRSSQALGASHENADARFPNRLSDFLVFIGTNVANAFFLRSRRTFSVRRNVVFEKSRSERNNFERRNLLPTNLLSINAVKFRRGVASDLSFKIVPNLDTTFIGLIE